MQQPPPLPKHMEIANLEHRLTRLREQEQAFARQSDLLKRAIWIALPVLAVVVTVLAFTTQRDPVPMLVLFAILIVATAVAARIFRHADWSSDLKHVPGPRNRYTSYRAFLEESIRDCERSLAELKAQP